jgi:lactoylglutathione lyase
MKELGIIDVAPWGNVRQLPDGAMQMFVRDPSGNLVEITSRPQDHNKIDPAIFTDELFKAGLYVSGRNDFRGYKAENATLYTGE